MHTIRYYRDIDTNEIKSSEEFSVDIAYSAVDKLSRVYTQTKPYETPDIDLIEFSTDQESFMLALSLGDYKTDTTIYAVEMIDPNERYVLFAKTVEELIEKFQSHRDANFNENFYDDPAENDSWRQKLDAMIENFRADPTTRPYVGMDYDQTAMYPIIVTMQQPPARPVVKAA